MTTLFLSQEYNSFLSSTGFLIPFRFSINREGQDVGVIQGYIQKDGGRLKRFFSRRAIINGGPYFDVSISEEDIRNLLRECIKGLKGEVIYIETRNFQDYSKYNHVFEECGFIYEPHYDFIINTESLEVAEANLGKSRKRDIKASLKNGVSIIEDASEEQLKSFYCVLSDLYKTKVKTPLFPLEFFIKLNHTDFSKFILVEYNGEIVGGTVCVFDEETVYEWFACGKDGVYKNVFPSTLATWSGIKFAAESSRKRFDMMGAGAPGDGGYGVRDFKAKFGGELVEYGRFKYVCNKPLYFLGKIAVAMMKR